MTNNQDTPSIYPVNASFGGKWSWFKQILKTETDSDVFPPCTNKMKTFGVKNRRNFHIMCDGKGKMKHKEILTTQERMDRLMEWKINGWISQEEFEKKRKEILGDL